MKRLAAYLCSAALLAAMAFAAAPRLPVPADHAESRSGHWPKVRAEHLLVEPACAACGHNVDLEVHHVKPFHLHPDLELVDGNLVTLCRRCHQLLGHLDQWKSFNREVREDAALIRKRIKERP